MEMDCVDLKLCTFNCCSLKNNIDLVRELTGRKYDVIMLQETFVTEDQLGIIDYIDENYDCIAVPATFSEKVLAANAGRQEGGMAILWRKASNLKVNKVSIENNFMVFNFAIGNVKIVVVNVYMNSDLWEVSTLNKYLESLSKLENILAEVEFDSIYYAGDFNADPVSGRAWRNLSNFNERNGLMCLDAEVLPPDSFTFVGYGNSATRWLDHIIGRQASSTSIHDINVLYEMIGSDHLPVEFSLKVFYDSKYIRENVHHDIENTYYYINWKYIRPVELKDINRKINCKMKFFYDNDILHCTTIGCRNKEHLKKIDDMYTEIVVIFRDSVERFKKKTVKKDKFKVVPGWNRNVKYLHSVARQFYLEWVTLERPLNTVVHDRMLKSRKEFKAALRNCKLNVHEEICKSISEKFQMKNMREFWTEVKKQKGFVKTSSIIDGENENDQIVKVFAKKFFGDQDLQCETENDFLTEFKTRWGNSRKMFVKLSEVSLKKIITTLNSGMGHDGIHSVFLKGADEEFLSKLASFYNTCFTHCYIPIDLLIGIINPLVKDGKANITEVSNYRPVMQSSCLLKIFECHILNILSEKISFNPRQFGFMKGVSTTDTCFLLKEIMHDHSRNRRTGILTFMDLSKAFDRVDHFMLGNKLMKENIPIDIIYILMHYFRNQTAKIVWSDASSAYFPIEWGVRQGGILSPFLFKFYVNSIITDISNMEEGCSLGLSKVNILAYADDIVLVASHISDMNVLYEGLKQALHHHGLLVNRSKTKCLLFGSKYKQNCPTSVVLGDDDLEVVKSYKYLGHYIEGTLSDDKDIEHKLMKFYASTNSVLRNFKNVDVNTLLFLFSSYCKPFYGLTLWNSRSSFNRCIYKSLNVAYNNALKKILGVPLYASNHLTAVKCGHLLLKHQIALLQANYYFRLLKSDVPIIRINLPFLKRGYFFNYIYDLFKVLYEVELSHHSPDIIKSRIIWVQMHEERRGRCPYFLI